MVAFPGDLRGRTDQPARFSDETSLDSRTTVSRWTLGGEEYLAGQTATAQVAAGSGRVVLFAFTPHFRGQPSNTFKLLFKAPWGSSTEELPLGGAGACAG